MLSGINSLTLFGVELEFEAITFRCECFYYPCFNRRGKEGIARLKKVAQHYRPVTGRVKFWVAWPTFCHCNMILSSTRCMLEICTSELQSTSGEKVSQCFDLAYDFVLGHMETVLFLY